MTSVLRLFAQRNVCMAPELYAMSSRGNCNRAAISRLKRKLYPQMYPALLVLPDGSTINIRYKEPRKLVTLPVDYTTLSEEEKAIRLAQRKPKEKIIIVEDIQDNFDVNKYLRMGKKK